MRACEALIMANIGTLPVSPSEVAGFFGIKLVSYEECGRIYERSREELYRESRFGFSFCAEGGYVCAVNENACGEKRRRWTIAHEIGHCLLGHVDGEQAPTLEQEREADRFAAELLAPLTVLHFCGVRSAEELRRLCGLSKQAGEIRFRELTELRRGDAERFRRWRITDREEQPPKGGFLCSNTDLRLLVQFSGFVGQYIYDAAKASIG